MWQNPLFRTLFLFVFAVRPMILEAAPQPLERARTIVENCGSIAELIVEPEDQSGLPHFLVRLGKSSQFRTKHIYVGGAFHGDEPITPEAIFAFLEYVCGQSSNDQMTQLLSRLTIYLEPVVNPFGLMRGLRKDHLGIDPNRDFPVPSDQQFKFFAGNEAFRLDRLMRRLEIDASLALHAGTEAVFYPNGFTARSHPLTPILSQVAAAVANALNFKKFGPSLDDYPSLGEYSDYMVHTFGAVALTLEISREKSPNASSVRDRILERTIRGILQFVNAIDQL